jgi:hypothetical protein
MAKAANGGALEVSLEAGNNAARLDDDGRPRRTGTVWTASAHIITAVIGSGVLSLAWAIAQLGWAAGPAVMLLFAGVIYYTSTLLAECYRTGGPGDGEAQLHLHGRRSFEPPRRQGQAVWCYTVRQPRRGRDRLHHRRLHQHAVRNSSIQYSTLDAHLIDRLVNEMIGFYPRNAVA